MVEEDWESAEENLALHLLLLIVTPGQDMYLALVFNLSSPEIRVVD